MCGLVLARQIDVAQHFEATADRVRIAATGELDVGESTVAP